jgi:UPF0716 protein FxsA
MTRSKLVLMVLLAVPVAELYGLVQLAAIIGFWAVFTLLLVAAVIGGRILQNQSWSIWNRLQENLARGEHPGRELLEAAVIMVGGLLLIIPGFLSDLVGVLCLLPTPRRWLLRQLEQRSGNLVRGAPPADSRTIDGEYRRER